MRGGRGAGGPAKANAKARGITATIVITMNSTKVTSSGIPLINHHKKNPIAIHAATIERKPLMSLKAAIILSAL
jgi:hypothetical protein